MLRPPSLFTSCIFVERLANVRLLRRLELGQVQNGQGSNPFGQKIAMARAADNSGASNSRSTHYIADEIEVHCVSSGGGTSAHLASKSSRRPATSTTKSTSRVRSRQKNR